MLVLPAGGGGVGALGGSSTTAGSTGAASKKKNKKGEYLHFYKQIQEKNLVLIHSIFLYSSIQRCKCPNL